MKHIHYPVGTAYLGQGCQVCIGQDRWPMMCLILKRIGVSPNKDLFVPGRAGVVPGELPHSILSCLATNVYTAWIFPG